MELLAKNYVRSMTDQEPHKAGQIKKQGSKMNKKKQNQNMANPAQLHGKLNKCGSTARKSREYKLDRSIKVYHVAKLYIWPKCGSAQRIHPTPPLQLKNWRKQEKHRRQVSTHQKAAGRTIKVRQTST